MSQKKKKRKISENIQETEAYMTKTLGVNISYDVGFRELFILKTTVQIYYVNGLVEDSNISQLIKVLIGINDNEVKRKKVVEIIKNRLVNLQIEPLETLDESIDQLLSGLIVLFIDGHSYSYAIDVRRYPGRSPEEPDTERVVRGSRDGFTENIVENSALIRRRIRDARLRQVMLKVGERSKTDVCVSYIQDIANDSIVNTVKNKIRKIEIDGITMADKALEEFFVERKWNPFPLVRYTERPDVASNHLLEGHVIVTVDTSPSALILPTTYFDHLEHAEEYRQTPTVGTFIRWIRLFALLISIFITPLWLLFVMNPELLPQELSYIGPSEKGNVSIFIQILTAFIGVEFLRMAAIHTPTPLATALGLIAAVLIGEIAIEVGLLSSEVILYVAISTVGTYVTPSYELSIANRIFMLCLLILTYFFAVKGFMIGLLLGVIYLVHLKSLKVPYMWPLVPFHAEGFLKFLLRIPVPFSKKRPIILQPKNLYNQLRKS